MNVIHKLNVGDNIPLKSGCKTTVFVSTATDNKIVLVDEKTRCENIKMDKPTILEINANVPTAMLSKKAKRGIILCLSVSILSVTLSTALAYHHCVNMSSLKNQVEIIMMKMENMSHKLSEDESLFSKNQEISSFKSEALSWRRFEDSEFRKEAVTPNITLSQTGLFVVQFQGAQQEVNSGLETKTGPWMLDTKISSPNSHTKVELDDMSFVVKEGGLYLVYAQVVYLTHEPCCYFIWARNRGGGGPRLLTTCSTGSDATARPLSKSQISCATQTVARLHANDVISIIQREHNRTMWMRPGYSYFGLIKLGS